MLFLITDTPNKASALYLHQTLIASQPDHSIAACKALADRLSSALGVVLSVIESPDLQLSAVLKATVKHSAISCAHWNEHEVNRGKTHICEILDHRRESGQVYVDIGPADGITDDDDILTISMEVSSLEHVGDVNLPTAHVGLGYDEMAFSVFKANRKIYIRPEAGVVFTPVGTASGEVIFCIE